jgi:hypothetical protein
VERPLLPPPKVLLNPLPIREVIEPDLLVLGAFGLVPGLAGVLLLVRGV